MAQPTFFLYRIVRKKDRKAFSAWRCFGLPRTKSYFTNGGAFYRTVGTIRNHLGYLTHENGDGYSADDFIVERYSVLKCSKKEFTADEVMGVENV